MWMVPIGTIGFGFALSRGLHIAVVLLFQVVLGYGQAVLMPTILGEGCLWCCL